MLVLVMLKADSLQLYWKQHSSAGIFTFCNGANGPTR